MIDPKNDPVVDIVLPVHDCPEWADLAIRSIEHQTKNRYRLIVVDSASREEKTKKLFEEVKQRGHTVVHLAENRSFSHVVNTGVALGKAPFIIVFNSDAIAHEGWDSALLQDAAEKTTGMVGARTNMALGPMGDPKFPAGADASFLVFVCVAMRRQVWDAVGPMDAMTFDGFSGEDLDYSWRVKQAGYKLRVSNAFVYHAGSRTLMNTVGPQLEQRRRNDEKYRMLLDQKWGKEWVAENMRWQPRILVMTYHAEEWTRVTFMAALQTLKNSGNLGYAFHNITRAPIHMARQNACDFAADNDFDVLVQLDDDATFPPEVIARLLSHGKEAVTALAYQRKPPHLTCVFELGDDGVLGRPMEGVEHTGLRKVDVSGFHCSAIKTSVIKKMRAAGIKQYFGGFENKVGEDFAFCLNMKKVGIPLYCDTDLISGHIGSAIIVDEQYKKDFVAAQGKK